MTVCGARENKKPHSRVVRGKMMFYFLSPKNGHEYSYLIFSPSETVMKIKFFIIFH